MRKKTDCNWERKCMACAQIKKNLLFYLRRKPHPINGWRELIIGEEEREKRRGSAELRSDEARVAKQRGHVRSTLKRDNPAIDRWDAALKLQDLPLSFTREEIFSGYSFLRHLLHNIFLFTYSLWNLRFSIYDLFLKNYYHRASMSLYFFPPNNELASPFYKMKEAFF